MKTRSITLSLVSLALLIALVQSCKHEPLPILPGDPGGGGGTGGGGTGTTDVCFQRDILPIFQTSCAPAKDAVNNPRGCHDAITHKEDLNLTTYANIKSGIFAGNPQQSPFFRVIADNSMPISPVSKLTQQQKDLISLWITQGAKDVPCASNCDTTKYAFINVQAVLTKYNCAACHGSTNPSKGIDLSAYAGVAAVAKNGQLYGAVAHSAGFVAMPSPAVQLDACELRIIQRWVADGARQ